MKKIVIFGSDRSLERELKGALGDEFCFATGQKMGEKAENAGAVAVVLVHERAELDGMENVRIPFVALSDRADAELLERAAALGAKYYFVSPVPAAMLSVRLADLAEKDHSRLC